MVIFFGEEGCEQNVWETLVGMALCLRSVSVSAVIVVNVVSALCCTVYKQTEHSAQHCAAQTVN